MRTHRNKDGRVKVPSYEEYVFEGLGTMFAGLILGLIFEIMQEFPDGPPRGLTPEEVRLRLLRRLGGTRGS